ncbi:cyclic AMP-dependent transcription factor ATF-2 [Uranotaenia lowii]|uniref:cyclic AMP-dependent transcription factor ATF-2 n=1 Tax=Uranotaenia lowii TaxID=190385 RepID=UPI00247AFEF2|nr:cyclic AMP-dependent transcription factor ATF-2 [Uranotaenia lowii]
MEPVRKKPFPCKIDGCKLAFATEDHLQVHRDKHDMLLNLELPLKANLFADQTPTPTRLIGKCEEVGLFEDLQHVNPFEETFRRAVEENQSSEKVEDTSVEKSTSGCEMNDDTLHTPHIFPLLERRESMRDRPQKLSKLIISRANSTVIKEVSPILDAEPVHKSSSEPRKEVKIKQEPVVECRSKSLINILPKVEPQSSVIANSSIHEPVNSLKGNFDAIHPVKIKLKAHLEKNNPKKLKTDPQPLQKMNIIKSERRPPVGSTSYSSSEKTEIHDRWKAAAKRYRARVKQNQGDLIRKNSELEEENRRLRTELACLRKDLALHRDCPVTKALLAGSKQRPTVATTKHHQSSQPLPVPIFPIPPSVDISKGPLFLVIGGASAIPLTTTDTTKDPLTKPDKHV